MKERERERKREKESDKWDEEWDGRGKDRDLTAYNARTNRMETFHKIRAEEIDLRKRDTKREWERDTVSCP